MTNKGKRAVPGDRRAGRKQSDESMVDRGFDLFLNRQLHQLYDPVLNEPIPEELLRLLNQFDDRAEPAKEEKPDAGDRDKAGKQS